MVTDGEGTANRQAELDNFHRVLMDISEGKATRRTRDFIINAYVRGAASCGGCIENAGIENSTAVFTKRRFRVEGSVASAVRGHVSRASLFARRNACSITIQDRWNRNIMKRIAKTRNHSLKIKARIRTELCGP